MVRRDYFVRRAAFLLKFAKETKDPRLAAVLIEKAADCKMQVDESMPSRDLGSRAPDVEPPAS